MTRLHQHIGPGSLNGRRRHRPRSGLFTVTKKMITGGRFEFSHAAFCHACPAHEQITALTLYPEEMLIRKFAAIGWVRKNSTLMTCPSCLTVGRIARHHEKEPAVTSNPTLSLAASSKPTGMATLRKIFDSLDEHFDAAAGLYATGYSDQRIGMDLNVPWAEVAKAREEAYGPIKSIPEIDGLRADVDKALNTLTAISDRINDLERRLGGKRP